ncbi:adenosylhomocysteinase [Kribbella sp. NPDC050124]|uniref:adenosylhomocysteinase n=1 Tax=Kribbella sp. NPDC050124 TaxID=3364114 RepID=UPI0037A893CD
MNGDAQLGENQIGWVRRNSPVLDGFVREILSDGGVDGLRVALVAHIEAKTAFLATVLADAGAELVVAGRNPRTTNRHVVAALRDRGIDVVSEAGGSRATSESDLLTAAAREPQFIIDDGAELTMRIAQHRPALFAALHGVAEGTTTGTARLRRLHACGKLPFSALTTNDARCKGLFDSRHGTGQTTLQAILRLTNRQIAGARLAVIGYGTVGRAVAQYAAAMGALTSVVETDPVRALEAHMDGHAVGRAALVLPTAQVVVTATGGTRGLGKAEFRHLSNDVVLANAGHRDVEIDLEALRRVSVSQEVARRDVTTYRLDGRDVHALAEGALVDIAGGSGHPVESMDLTSAAQGLGIHYLAAGDLAPGVHVIPAALDDSIAAARLKSLGVTLDQVKPEQIDDVGEWIGMENRDDVTRP